MLAISTCWNQSRHNEGAAIIDEILALGVSNIELSHGMSMAKMPGFLDRHREGKFTCTGVHNFFPSPVEVFIDAPDAYEFSDKKRQNRDRAIKLTIESIRNAAKFGAKYIVLHMGTVTNLKHEKGSSLLESMLKEGNEFTANYGKAKAEFVQQRQKKAKPFVERAVEALEMFIEPAREHGVKLAIESRSHYEQIPTEDEMVVLMEQFRDTPEIGYWHDFGHIQRKHNLGLLDHRRWLECMSEFLIGGHFHDVHWPHKDHRPPFTGNIHYEPLMEHFTPEMPIAWEINNRQSTESIKTALEEWHKRDYTSRLT